MGNPVVWFEVQGADGPALREFYGKAFGWEYQTMEGMDYGMVSANGGIGGGIGTSPDENTRWVTFYVAVDDVQAALDQVNELGGRTVMPVMEIPGGPTIAVFSDPEGHVIGLVKNDQQQS